MNNQINSVKYNSIAIFNPNAYFDIVYFDIVFGVKLNC